MLQYFPVSAIPVLPVFPRIFRYLQYSYFGNDQYLLVLQILENSGRYWDTSIYQYLYQYCRYWKILVLPVLCTSIAAGCFILSKTCYTLSKYCNDPNVVNCPNIVNDPNVVNDHTIVNLNSSNVVHDQIVVNCPNVVKHPTVVNCPYK